MTALGTVVEHYVLLCSLIFAVGAVGFLVRRNTLVQLMSIELMLNAVNLGLVAYNRVHADSLHGHMFAFFIIAVAAAEAAVALAIVLAVYRSRRHISAEDVNLMKW